MSWKAKYSLASHCHWQKKKQKCSGDVLDDYEAALNKMVVFVPNKTPKKHDGWIPGVLAASVLPPFLEYRNRLKVSRVVADCHPFLKEKLSQFWDDEQQNNEDSSGKQHLGKYRSMAKSVLIFPPTPTSAMLPSSTIRHPLITWPWFRNKTMGCKAAKHPQDAGFVCRGEQFLGVPNRFKTFQKLWVSPPLCFVDFKIPHAKKFRKSMLF